MTKISLAELTVRIGSKNARLVADAIHASFTDRPTVNKFRSFDHGVVAVHLDDARWDMYVDGVPDGAEFDEGTTDERRDAAAVVPSLLAPVDRGDFGRLSARALPDGDAADRKGASGVLDEGQALMDALEAERNEMPERVKQRRAAAALKKNRT